MRTSGNSLPDGADRSRALTTGVGDRDSRPRVTSVGARPVDVGRMPEVLGSRQLEALERRARRAPRRAACQRMRERVLFTRQPIQRADLFEHMARHEGPRPAPPPPPSALFRRPAGDSGD